MIINEDADVYTKEGKLLLKFSYSRSETSYQDLDLFGNSFFELSFLSKCTTCL